MKKFLTLLVLALLLLSGCKDAVAKLSNPKEALITFGSTKITKEEIYEVLSRQDGFATVTGNVRSAILTKEIETTKEAEEAAKKKLEEEKENYGEQFLDYIKYNGYATEEDYLNNYLIPNEKSSALAEKYINENWENVITTYYPAQVQIIETDSSEKVTEALKRVNDGEHFEVVGAEVSMATNKLFDGMIHVVSASDSSTLSTYITDFIKKTNEDGTMQVVENSAGDKFYLVRLVSKDALAFKQEAVESIQKSTDLNTEMMAYYYKKYGFHVYDISLYDYMKSYYPTYLHQ